MGAYKLKIIDDNQGLNFNVRYENMARSSKPEIIAEVAKTGTRVHERTIYNGEILLPGSTTKHWVDDSGKIYSKTELKFYTEEDGRKTEVEENEQSKVFNILDYEPEANYSDKYVIGAFYEIYPSDDGLKRDLDRNRAKNANLGQMRRLWEYLRVSRIVARAEFITSSKGFVASDGYIRAIEIEGKWGLEIGVFKESKVFTHLNEGVPQMVEAKDTGAKRIKRI